MNFDCVPLIHHHGNKPPQNFEDFSSENLLYEKSLRNKKKLCFFAYVLQVLYSRIAIALWKSSQGIERHIQMQNTPSSFTTAANSLNANNGTNPKNSTKYEKRPVGATESQVNFIRHLPFCFHALVVPADARHISQGLQCFQRWLINLCQPNQIPSSCSDSMLIRRVWEGANDRAYD